MARSALSISHLHRSVDWPLYTTVGPLLQASHGILHESRQKGLTIRIHTARTDPVFAGPSSTLMFKQIHAARLWRSNDYCYESGGEHRAATYSGPTAPGRVDGLAMTMFQWLHNRLHLRSLSSRKSFGHIDKHVHQPAGECYPSRDDAISMAGLRAYCWHVAGATRLLALIHIVIASPPINAHHNYCNHSSSLSASSNLPEKVSGTLLFPSLTPLCP